MAHYTVLDKKALQTILQSYGLGDVKSYRVLSGGSENTNYLVCTEGQDLVVTICEQKSTQTAKELAALLDYLALNNFSTSKLIKTMNGALTTTWNGKPVILKAFIAGHVLEDLPENILVSLGKELAQLHQIAAPDYLPTAVSYGIERFDEVLVYAPDSLFYTWLKNAQAYIEDYIHTDLPKALIHSDIFYSNIIVAENHEQAIIMDFEEACSYYRVFDIGMMIIGTCCDGEKLNLDKTTSLLLGYQQELKLLSLETSALQAFTVYGAAATAFWRHQNFNYVKPDPSMKDHYLAMKNQADNVRDIPSEVFNQIF